MLSVVDFLVVASIMSVFGFIGYYFRLKRSSTAAEFYLAKGRMTAIPAAISISATYVTSSSLTIFIGEVCAYGVPSYLIGVAALVAGPLVIYFALNRLYNFPYLSIFEFLEHRFSRSVRVVNSLIFLITGLVHLALVGYTVAISAETLAEIPFWISAIVSGILCTTYSTMGGIRSVIWTDVFQTALMLLFLLLICFKALFSFETFDEFWTLVINGKRLELNFKEGPTHRYTTQSLFLSSIVLFLHVSCVNQATVQRYKSVGSLKEARKTIAVGLIAIFIFTFFAFFCAIVLYAFYARCRSNDEFPTPDKISLYFVKKEFSHWPGVTGLCLTGVLSSALSTISSYVNSMAAITLEDLVKLKFKSLSERQELIISKVLTAVYGLTATGFVFLANLSKEAAKIHITCIGISLGPPLGVFVLGMWTDKANTLGVHVGLTISVVLITWMSIGSFSIPPRHHSLSTGNPACPVNQSSIMDITYRSISNRIMRTGAEDQGGFLHHLYGISFYWYSILSFAVAIITGYIFSILLMKFCKTSGNAALQERELASKNNDIGRSLLTRPVVDEIYSKQFESSL